MKLLKAKDCQARTLLRGSVLLVVLLAAFLAPAQAAVEPAKPVNLVLTDAERAWLAQHPRIQVGIMDAWPPLNYLDQNQIPQGIGVDYLAALNKRLGNALVPVPAPFEKNYALVQSRHLDALMDISQRPDREALFNFTRPYIVIPHVIVGRKGEGYLKTEQDLVGKIIALERSFHNITYFRKNYPQVTVREYESTSAALDAVSRGEADAYAGNRAVVVYLMEKELLNNLRLMGRLTEPKSTLQFGVRKGQSRLAAILDKALASLTAEEERTIRQKWLQENGQGLELSKSERAWLKAHPTIRVALDPAWAPVEFLDEHGIPRGIAPDYLQKLGELLGVRFEIAKGQEWPSLLEGVRRRDLDMIPALHRTEERETYLGFTDSYLSLPIGIFTSQEAQYIASINELAGKKIAVVKGHAVEQILTRQHPGLRLIPATSIVTALQMLARGEVAAVVDSTVSIGYYLSQLGMTNIKLAGETPYRYELAMGVRSDWPELAGILNKALLTIPKSERNDLYGKWTALPQERQVDYGLILKILAGALGVVALFAFWNWRLGHEVATRKKAETQLRASQHHLMHTVDALNANKEELEAANRKLKEIDHLKSLFIASMSHELRTPLNSIIGFTGILLQGLAGELNGEQKKQLGMVKSSSEHLLALITDIIDLSKIEAGKIDLSLESFDLAEVVSEVLGSFQVIAERKALALAAEMPPSLMLVSDKRRIRQVLVNLVGNAMKFTQQGGVTVTARAQDGILTVAVRDTGLGIKAEDLGRLFKSFSQVTTVEAPKHEGSGLGLYLSRRLITLLGGEIGVESEFGKGSVFSFTLPIGK
jgi:signal transduction histidine kinase